MEDVEHLKSIGWVGPSTTPGTVRAVTFVLDAAAIALLTRVNRSVPFLLHFFHDAHLIFARLFPSAGFISASVSLPLWLVPS